MGTATIAAHDLAERIVAEVHAARDRRIEAESADPDSWTDADSWRRYVRVLEGIGARATGEREVTVWAPDTPDGRLWGYAAAEVLDSGADRADPDGLIGETGFIHHASRRCYRLTW